jgi:hypothetical protein
MRGVLIQHASGEIGIGRGWFVGANPHGSMLSITTVSYLSGSYNVEDSWSSAKFAL